MTPRSLPCFSAREGVDSSDILDPDDNLFERIEGEMHFEVATIYARYLSIGFQAGFEAAVKLGKKTIAEGN